MQEDINRKIQVHNTSPILFSLFLEYLYSGRLDYSSLSVEQISELLLLSDRYEVDSLKQACEHELKSHLDIESVIYFFSMADQSNANILKVYQSQCCIVDVLLIDITIPVCLYTVHSSEFERSDL